jgi:hypothetical protein
MKTETLPSGKSILVIDDENNSESSSEHESTSGAMELDVLGQCPKCLQQMGNAISGNEQVFYCESCRTTLPLSVEI